MNRIRIALIALFISVPLSALIVPAQSVSKYDEHQEWITNVLKDIQKIKVGTTRGEMLKVFEEEGGTSTTSQQTYVYRGCPYIKVDFQFEPHGRKKTNHDLITSMSKPYLEFSIID